MSATAMRSAAQPSPHLALEGVEDKLRAGTRVADVGCGHGASTILLGEAYPNSTFVGYDYHQASVDAARQRAADAGLPADRVSFEVAAADEYPGTFDVVAIFDALHDMGDPAAVARDVRQSIDVPALLTAMLTSRRGEAAVATYG